MCIYIYIHLHIHIYTHTCIHIYIHKHTHTIRYSHTSEDYHKTEFQKQKLLAHSWVSPVHRRDDNLQLNDRIKQTIRVHIFPFHACLLIPTLFSFLFRHVFDRLCGLVVRASGYRYRGLGFDSRRYQIF